MSDDEEIAKKIDRKVFPGSQGGPLMHMVAAKAIAFQEALQPSFRNYSRAVVDNASALAPVARLPRLQVVLRRNGQPSHAGGSSHAGFGIDRGRRGAMARVWPAS